MVLPLSEVVVVVIEFVTVTCVPWLNFEDLVHLLNTARTVYL
jgi:chloramphenicol O-acetyltransferase